MDAIWDMPVWLQALMIFALRIGDVSVGTMRTIMIVQGMVKLSVLLGFVEVLVWITVVSRVITGIPEAPWLLLPYAAGFAVGNAAGIAIERKLALGSVVVTIISHSAGAPIAEMLRTGGRRLTTFLGEGQEGPVTMIYAISPRREVREMVERARSLDPQLFYAVEPVREWQGGTGRALPHSTGWRAIFKKK